MGSDLLIFEKGADWMNRRGNYNYEPEKSMAEGPFPRQGGNHNYSQNSVDTLIFTPA